MEFLDDIEAIFVEGLGIEVGVVEEVDVLAGEGGEEGELLFGEGMGVREGEQVGELVQEGRGDLGFGLEHIGIV